MHTKTTPLAARMRPVNIDEIVGQRHIIGAQSPLRSALGRGELPSLLLWGPPGCGKTTLARLLAAHADLKFIQLSAVMDGIKELRQVFDRVRDARTLERKGTLLFIDEIHRWNKAQQDALLPHVEEGTVVLVGATTENPGFQVIPALRSRSWVLTLESLSDEDLVILLERALSDGERGLGARSLRLERDALFAIARTSSGDARRALATLERVAAGLDETSLHSLEAIREHLSGPDLLHDRDGDSHYDLASALIKSLRGSDPDAALYWTARLIEGGEDPMFIARRLIIFASEDIGNADPRALTLAVSTMQGVHNVGMPEGRILLGQAVTYLATAPKSNAAYSAINAAIDNVRNTGPLPVPAHLRNAPTAFAKQQGHGNGYLYPHDHPHHIVEQRYLPESMDDVAFYQPTNHGAERVIRERIAWWHHTLAKRK